MVSNKQIFADYVKKIINWTVKSFLDIFTAFFNRLSFDSARLVL